MTNTPPILREWHGLKPPEICTANSLGRTIAPDHYSQVYWIAKIVDNVIVEWHPLTDWHFAADGKLFGSVDTGVWKLNVSIQVDEYVILSVV